MLAELKPRALLTFGLHASKWSASDPGRLIPVTAGRSRMGSRAGLDTGEDRKVVPLPQIQVSFLSCPPRILVTVVPEASGVDLTSCHEERKKYGVRGASALKPLSERKRQREIIRQTEKEKKRKQGRKRRGKEIMKGDKERIKYGQKRSSKKKTN